MAEEIGTGYVSLVPSLKGFSRLVQRALRKEFGRDGIEIPVKPVFDKDLTKSIGDADAPTVPVHLDPLTRALHDELRRVSTRLARTLAIDLPVRPDTDRLRAKLTAQLDEAQAGLRAEIPVDPEGRRAYQAKLRALLLSVHETQHVDVDVDKNQLRKLEKQTADSGSFLGRIFNSAFSSWLFNPVTIAAALAAVVVTLPFVGGLVGAVTVAGFAFGSIFAGAFGLRADSDLQKAVKGLGAQVNSTFAETAKPLKGPFLEAIKILSGFVSDIAPDLKDLFAAVGPFVPLLAKGLTGFLGGFLPDVVTAMEAAGPIIDQIVWALPDIGDAIGQFLTSFSDPETVANTADAIGKFLRGTADLIRFLGSAFAWLARHEDEATAAIKATGHFVQTLWSMSEGVRTVIGWIIKGFLVLGGTTKNVGWAMVALFNAVKSLPGDLARLWDWLWKKVTGGARSATDTVVGFARGIPGRIATAVGNLGKLLVQAGRNVVQGLIDGIRDKLGALSSIASSVAQTIRNFLPFSPAKEGPLSGSGNPYHSGQVIAGDLAGGVESQLPAVASAASRLAGQFGLGGPSLAAHAAGAGFTIDTAGSRLDQLLLEVLREAIRVRNGGNVELALGS